MKIAYLTIVLFLGSVFVISGCTQETTSLPVTEKDCGSDMNCYVDSLKTCSPAKHYVSEGDQFAQMRVLLLEGTVCKTEWKSNGGEMICEIPQSDLSKVSEEDLTAGYIVTEICSGSLADQLASQIQT